MKTKKLTLLCTTILFLTFISCESGKKQSVIGKFNIEKDLLLAQYDCKTDVDDLHSVAALKTFLSDPKFSNVKFHAVAGTYGTQKGKYVPPNELFQLAFGDNWSDAHENFQSAVEEVKAIVKIIFEDGGDVWIAEAGQSDFSAALVKSIQEDLPDINTTQRIHIVQHSDWNEEATSPESLAYVKQQTDYHKIPDGNSEGNGTPGFRSPDYTNWQSAISDPELMEIWQLAIDLGNKYNGKDGRYNNEAVAAGGLDFSDFSEVCWIFGMEDIKDTEEFFSRFGD